MISTVLELVERHYKEKNEVKVKVQNLTIDFGEIEEEGLKKIVYSGSGGAILIPPRKYNKFQHDIKHVLKDCFKNLAPLQLNLQELQIINETIE